MIQFAESLSRTSGPPWRSARHPGTEDVRGGLPEADGDRNEVSYAD